MKRSNHPKPSKPEAEAALIREASLGDLEAFNQLVLLYQSLAYNYAYGMLGDPDSADDVTQESFIKAFKNIHSFRGGSFRAWLLRIVSNTAYDVMRQSKQHPTQSLFPEDEDGEEIESVAWLVYPSASVEATVEQNEDSERIVQLLDELPAIHRSVLTLVDIYELDYSEAAEILNVSLGTVKSRLARARLQMRRKIQADLRYSFQLNQRMALFPS